MSISGKWRYRCVVCRGEHCHRPGCALKRLFEEREHQEEQRRSGQSQKEQDNDKDYKCLHCGDVFVGRINFQIHWYLEHSYSGEMRVTCTPRTGSSSTIPDAAAAAAEASATATAASTPKNDND